MRYFGVLSSFPSSWMMLRIQQTFQCIQNVHYSSSIVPPPPPPHDIKGNKNGAEEKHQKQLDFLRFLLPLLLEDFDRAIAANFNPRWLDRGDFLSRSGVAIGRWRFLHRHSVGWFCEEWKTNEWNPNDYRANTNPIRNFLKKTNFFKKTNPIRAFLKKTN